MKHTTLIAICCISMQLGCADETPVINKQTPSNMTEDLRSDMTGDLAVEMTDHPADLPTKDIPPDLFDQGMDHPIDLPTTQCGNGVVEAGELCDDNNEENGDLCSSTCQPTYPCAPFPIACDDAQVSTKEHKITTIPSCSFGLKPWTARAVTQRKAIIDALVSRSAGQRNIEQILGDLNRTASSGITTQNAQRLKNHDWSGFRWNNGDMNVSYWYPQGITGTSDAVASGKINGKEAVLVSWYHKTDERPTRGVRLSLANTTDLDNVTYRHLLLVEPTGTASAPDFKPALTSSGNALHAGGIVWYNNLLYVADTSGGLRVYDLSNILKMSHFDKERVGVGQNRVDAHGYAYAVPEIMRYTHNKDGCPLKFSFVSLDRSSSPPALITGEYHKDHPNGRLAIWALDPQTGLLDARQNYIRAIASYIGGQTKMQGATRFEGNLYISSSSQYQQYGRLYRTRPGLETSSISAWVYGAEDLYVDRQKRIIWTAAEHPGARDVVGIPIKPPSP